MSANLKRIGICLMSMVLTFQIILSPFLLKNVYALEDVDIYGENVIFYIKETPIKRIITAVMENGQQYLCECINSTGKVYMNEYEIEYSFTEGAALLKENSLTNINTYELNASNPWTPETIVHGNSINFAPLINGGGTAVAVGTQIYLGMLGVTASSLIEKLAKATLKQHWAVVAKYCGDSILDLIGANTSKVVNVTFEYDLQKTKGMVDLMGSGVKVYAYRYANYTGTVLLLGHKFTKNTNKCGGWWSASKPYGIELPESDY